MWDWDGGHWGAAGVLGVGQIGARAEIGEACRLGELVPRAHGQAIVAAIDAVAHGRAEFARDMAFVFDGEIGEAAAAWTQQPIER
jgi:hypothetical protein